MKTAIIGIGNLGLPIAKGLVANKVTTSLSLTKRNPTGLEQVTYYENVFATADNREAIAKSGVGVFAVQPRYFLGVLAKVKDLLISYDKISDISKD